MVYLVKDLLTLREKEITSSEYEMVMSHIEALKRFSCEIDYYKMVETAINEYLMLQNIIQIDSYENFVILNFRFSNWLNAFYMWKAYHYKVYSSETGELIDRCRKESIVFNLVQVLRNHAIHDDFAISSIRFDVLNEKSSYLIEPSDILRSNVTSPLKKWLKEKISAREKIDSIECLELFNKVFNDLQSKIWDVLLPNNLLRFKECIEILKIDGDDIRNIVIEAGEESYMAGHVLNGINDKIQIVISHTNID